MEHVCQNCGHSTQSSSAPRFCSECGTRFGQPDVADAATIAPDTQLVHDMATMVPGPAPGPSDSGRDALPGFQIVRELGRGGMGVVYEAVDEATGRSVALKLLASGFDRDEEAVQRFLREGKIAASLSHPRSTFVYDAGEVDGRFFITMELMSGGTLKDIVDREGKLSVTQAVNHTIDMLDGLEAAHTVDVVHRDVKPSNSFVTSDGRVKVGDFGISKSLVSDASLTVTGAFMGTPQFAAPEQIRAGKIDNRTDLYSVGATLFYLLAGRAPFQGDAIQVVADIVSEPAPLLHSIESEVPEELSQIIARVMEKDPENRPQTAGELKLALLPFSSRKSSIGDVGLRLAAFFVDSTLCSAVLSLLALVVLGFMDRTGDLVGANKTGQLVVVSVTFLLTLVYFAFCESRWGRGVGKWLMGLRVMNERGQAPGFGMAFLRAAIAPGLANLVRSFLPLLYAWNSNSAAGVTADTGNLVAVSVGFPLLSLSVGLIVLSSMRRTNGFRGLHDFATRTRVVRLHAKAARKTAPAVMVPIKESVSAGPQYDVAGSLAKTDSYAVYAATDKMLARPVWLMASDANEAPLSAERVGVARGTRQHVLRHHVQDGQRWDALEAVSGVPVAEIDFEKEAYSWTAIREALIDLGEELHTASKDGTLPAEMTLQQVWIDSAGRVKLLDRPVGGSTSEMATKVLNPKQLLCAVLERCRLMLPGEGLDLLHALRSKPDSPETLEWAIEQLSQLGHRPGRMTWDERLGAIAISFGIELTFVQTMSLVMAIVIHMLQPQVLIAVAIAVALPLIVGFAFRGGPVFRLAGLEVRRHGRPASAVRCAIRNLVAWVPITVGSALLMWFVGEMFHAEGQQTSAGTRAAFFGITLVGMTIGLLGAVAAVLMPRRGVQDIVAGTELVVR